MFQNKNKEIIFVKKDGIEFIQFKRLLNYGIKHAYTLKSNDIDFGFNQKRNFSSYEKLCKVLNIDVNTIVQPVQTHSNNVKCIDKVETTEMLNNVDGLITNKLDITLTTKNADCILFILFDPKRKVIANIHSGWKGTFQKIVEKAVLKMVNYYDCKAKDILCFISPSIRKDHFEVDEDVKEICERIFYYTGRIEEFIEIGKEEDGIKKYNIDTVLINRIMLESLGIKKENIIDCGICSVCNGDKVESVRVEGNLFGGRATMIVTL